MNPERRQLTLINNQGLRDSGGGPTIIRKIVERFGPWHDITIISFDAPADTSIDVEQITLPRLGDAHWRLKPLTLARHYRHALKTVMPERTDILIGMDCHLGLTFPSLPARQRVYISLSCIPRQEWFGSAQKLPLIFLQYVFLERRMIRSADITAVASDNQRREISRFELIPGFDPLILRPVFSQPEKDSRATSPTETDDDSAPVEFLTVCRLTGVKRADRILEVASRLRDENCRFTVVGDGGNFSELVAACKNLGLDDCVTFVGPSDNPEEYFHRADILLHPSAYESFGIAIFEAMCHGVIPACATGPGSNIGIADDIQDGENGVLLNFADMDTVIGTLRGLINDPARRQRMKGQVRILAQSMLQEDYTGKLAQALGLRVT